ncbi:MAG: PTS system mannose/fructose/sorbose family transporter subunit IID [Erysipelotrichaceae bacterium]|nr:PTS system mannose/fructose/sorbose family transporter subunit IID [Erysipelotrichaceae bacterium]
MSKKLSQAALKKACNRHNWTLQWCWNYEKMQAAGYAYAMVPVIKELYDGEERQCRELERHMAFYNTHPGASALIFGAGVALEEGGQPEVHDSLKVALMGPLAGIGDTIQAVLVTPPFNIIAAGLANEGNGVAAILASTLPLVALFVIRWPLFNYGYKTGAAVINDVSGAGTLDKLQIAASVLGVTVMGGFVPSMIGATLPVKLGSDITIDGTTMEAKTLQSVLDAIFPCLVPLGLTFGCYALIKKAKMSPLTVILVLAVVAFVLGALGWMA